MPINPIVQFLPYVAIGIVAYLLLVRPVKREQAERDALLTNLKKNDDVVTSGGLVGVVSSIPSNDADVIIKVDGTRLRVRRDAIREVLPKNNKGSKDGKEAAES